MEEILSKIPNVIKLKETVEQIIDYIPLFAAIAALVALQDIPGTIRWLGDIARKIEHWTRHK